MPSLLFASVSLAGAVLVMPQQREEVAADAGSLAGSQIDVEIRLSGRALAALDHAPVVGASVSLRGYRPGPMGRWSDQWEGSDVLTDAEGRFEILLASGVRPRHLDVSSPGYGTWFLEEPAARHLRSGETIEVLLHPAAELSVSIRDLDGKPVNAPAVWLREASCPSSELDWDIDKETHHFSGLVPGDYWVSAMRLGGPGLDGHLWNDDAVQHVSLIPGEHRSIEAQLRPLQVVSGRVIDATGEPVEGRWMVFYLHELARMGNRVVTGDDGAFEIHTDAAEARYLVARLPDEAAVRLAFHASPVRAPAQDINLTSHPTELHVFWPEGGDDVCSMDVCLRPDSDDLERSLGALRSEWTRFIERGARPAGWHTVLRGLPPGKYAIVLSAGRGREIPFPLLLERNQPLRIDLQQLVLTALPAR